MASDTEGNDAEEPALQLQHPIVELEQDLGDAGNLLLGQVGPQVAVGKPSLQRVTGRELGPPVEHLLPVRSVADGRRLHQQPGVAGLAVGAGNGRLGLLLGRQGEELLQNAVGVVEQDRTQVMAGVDEPRGQAPSHRIHHRRPLPSCTGFKRQQIDVENLSNDAMVVVPSLADPALDQRHDDDEEHSHRQDHRDRSQGHASAAISTLQLQIPGTPRQGRRAGRGRDPVPGGAFGLWTRSIRGPRGAFDLARRSRSL